MQEINEMEFRNGRRNPNAYNTNEVHGGTRALQVSLHNACPEGVDLDTFVDAYIYANGLEISIYPHCRHDWNVDHAVRSLTS